MEYLPKSPFLQTSPGVLEMVRKQINMEKPGDMTEAVRILDEWVEKQPHFIDAKIPLRYLEMSIVMAKGSVERAKKMIENICVARTISPHYFEPRSTSEYYDEFKKYYSIAATQKLTSECYRVLILKLRGKVDNNVMESIYTYGFNLLDYLKVHDYCSGIVVVFDIPDLDMQHFMTHINLLELRNNFFVVLESYGMRLKNLLIVTESKAVHMALAFFKPFFSKKIYDRLKVLKNYEDLQEYYPKDVWPKDYGGTEKSIDELQESVREFLSSEEHLQHMKRMHEIKIDQSLSLSKQMNDGIYGTFRSLSID